MKQLTDGLGKGAGAGTPSTDVGASELLGASAEAFLLVQEGLNPKQYV